jgi:hypothetical protein
MKMECPNLDDATESMIEQTGSTVPFENIRKTNTAPFVLPPPGAPTAKIESLIANENPNEDPALPVISELRTKLDTFRML